MRTAVTLWRYTRLLLAFVFGFVIGSVVNMAFIQLGPQLIAPPAGADVTTFAGLTAALPLFEPRHFIFPFLAHALGTLCGAFCAAVVAPGQSNWPGYGVGVLFLLAGIANVLMLPAPLWFSVIDVVLAYAPMTWLALYLAQCLAQRLQLNIKKAS